MPGDDETFVLEPGPLRMTMLGFGLVLCAVMFLFMAAVAVAITVDNFFGRLALLLLGLLLTVLAIYLLLLLRTLVIRVEVGPERLKVRVPRLRGPLPLLSTLRAELPYSAIASVETREEVYSSFGIVTVQRSFRVVTRDGASIPLGIMAENWGAQMPYDQLSARIAARAGIPVVERGAVRVGGIVRAIVDDLPPWTTEAMTSTESNIWRRRAAMTMQFVVFVSIATALLRSCNGS
jgi:hypothetical protein